MIRVFRVAKLYKETRRAIDEGRKVLEKNKPKDNKVHPKGDHKCKVKSFLNKDLNKRHNFIINNESRKISFMK